jgi:hypothetical protein
MGHYRDSVVSADSRANAAFRRPANIRHYSLEAAAVEFVSENGGGAGVRLKKKKPGVRPGQVEDGNNGEM